MTEPNEAAETPYTTQGAVVLKVLVPYLCAISAFGYAVWTSANGATSVQQTVAFQGQEISQLVADDKANQTLSYSISTQLAQLNQSVADIKASLPHAGP
jgi:hypothetical protein